MKCKICGRTIEKNPIVSRGLVSVGNYDQESDVEQSAEMTRYYCSDKCSVIADLTSPWHLMMGDINAIANHLIKAHGVPVDLLEECLNSKEYKDLSKSL